MDGFPVFDMACGSGRDVFLLSTLVRAQGAVTGVDMTRTQLDVAIRNIDFHTHAFGYTQCNVSFVHGFVKDLASCGIPEESIYVVVSNCVINLSPDKPAVLAGIFRTLKSGGELYFSDVFSDRRISEHLNNDPVLYGECLSGAMYAEDFLYTLASLGVADHRVITSREISIRNTALQKNLETFGSTHGQSGHLSLNWKTVAKTSGRPPCIMAPYQKIHMDFYWMTITTLKPVG